MLSRFAPRSASRRALQALRTNHVCRNQVQRRSLVSAPRPGDGPLLERRPDRELPSIDTFRWSRTLPLFFLVIAAASVAIFNYQKLSSPVVASTLYSLRTNARARALLGDEIYFKHQIPWIRGEMNQLHGRIDIAFPVRGSRGEAVMRFASFRPGARALFETTEWSLTTPDGRTLDLLDGEDDDPFKGIVGLGMDEEERAAAADTRGFRQQIK
ncbi:cytochrome oxidase complex assembly protein 1-domain-containing protein [Xylariomycetidae sp. FL0641]|nr:cytochrome oxidase complex assembly protein 1-domain-containing protein [Xylariomycetidae sp. FL0641]